ncbi:MAG: cytochrome c [Synechocystis sp.]|nr:cytochrome c [Synechocystis sp.]
MSRVMDKSLSASPKISLHPLGTWFIAIMTVIVVVVVAWFSATHFDPYVSEVLSLDGDGNRGHAIFQANCAVCHGMEATGNIGPSLVGVHQRKSEVQLIKQVITGKTPPMPQFQPNSQEMADLLDYLETL